MLRSLVGSEMCIRDSSTTYGMMSFISNISCIQSDAYTAQRNKLIIRLPITKKVGSASQNEDPVSYTHLDAADDLLCVDLGGRRIIKKATINIYKTTCISQG